MFKEYVLILDYVYFNKDDSVAIIFNEIEELFIQIISDRKKVHENILWIIKRVDWDNENRTNYKKFSFIIKKWLIYLKFNKIKILNKIIIIKINKFKYI